MTRRGLGFRKVGERGVTMMEMLVVLVIVAVGAALAFPSSQRMAGQKRADAAIATLRMIADCVREYNAGHGIEGTAAATATTYSNIMGDDGDVATKDDNGCLNTDLFARDYQVKDYNPHSLAVPVAGDANEIYAISAKDSRIVCLTQVTDPVTAKVYDCPGTTDTAACVDGCEGGRVIYNTGTGLSTVAAGY